MLRCEVSRGVGSGLGGGRWPGSGTSPGVNSCSLLCRYPCFLEGVGIVRFAAGLFQAYSCDGGEGVSDEVHAAYPAWGDGLVRRFSNACDR